MHTQCVKSPKVNCSPLLKYLCNLPRLYTHAFTTTLRVYNSNVFWEKCIQNYTKFLEQINQIKTKQSTVLHHFNNLPHLCSYYNYSCLSFAVYLILLNIYSFRNVTVMGTLGLSYKCRTANLALEQPLDHFYYRKIPIWLNWSYIRLYGYQERLLRANLNSRFLRVRR